MSLEQQAAVAFELDGWQQTADRLLREAELLRAAREKVMAVLLAADVAIPESYDDLRAVAS